MLTLVTARFGRVCQCHMPGSHDGPDTKYLRLRRRQTWTDTNVITGLFSYDEKSFVWYAMKHPKFPRTNRPKASTSQSVKDAAHPPVGGDIMDDHIIYAYLISHDLRI